MDLDVDSAYDKPDEIVEIDGLPRLKQYDDGYGIFSDSEDSFIWSTQARPRIRTFGEFLNFTTNPDDVALWFTHYNFNIMRFSSMHSMNALEMWSYCRIPNFENYLNKCRLDSTDDSTDPPDFYLDRSRFTIVFEILTQPLPKELSQLIVSYISLEDCEVIPIQ